MEIKGTTIYTDEVCKKTIKFGMFKSKALTAILIISEIILIISLVISSISGQWQEDASFMGFMVFFLIFIPAILLLTPVFAAAAGKKLYGMENCYAFSEDGVVITQTSPTANGKFEAKYEMLHKIYETKDSFYIYLTKAQVFPLLKKDIHDGTADGLCGLLSEKLGKNFIRKG